MKKVLTISFVLLLLFSCRDKDRKITLAGSSGRINLLTIVVENSLWKGSVGDSLREIIASPVLGLPQEETQFSVSQAPPSSFGRLLKPSRNILIVGIDEKSGYSVQKDVYASPQIIMTILGKDKTSLIQQINAHRKEIISVFKKGDIELFQKKITKEIWKVDDVKTLSKLGIALKIPKTYALVDDTGDFLWFRQDIPKGSMNLIAYSFPLVETDSIANSIIARRDSIGKKNIPGTLEGMHMITELAYSPFLKQIQLDNKLTFESKGIWEMKNDFMAGPFLNYTVVDKTNNRLVIVEGFTFSPNVKKRDYMFELEAILKTLKL